MRLSIGAPARRLRRCVPGLLLAVSLAQVPAPAHGQVADAEWPTYGRDPGGSQFSPLRQIDATNVA